MSNKFKDVSVEPDTQNLLNEEEIKSMVFASPLVENDSYMTVTQSDSPFTFVNFNFEVK